MDNCVFCKIINKEINSWTVYETESVIVLLAKDMEVYGHTLVLAKKHYKTITEIPKELLSEMMEVSKKIIIHYQDTIGSTGVNIIGASGEGSQQSVPHFHFHLLPRFENDGLDARPKLAKIDINKDELLNKIKLI